MAVLTRNYSDTHHQGKLLKNTDVWKRTSLKNKGETESHPR